MSPGGPTRNAGSLAEPLSADQPGPVATLGGVPVAVHDHVCVFYRGSAERHRLALDHLQEGLRAGDTCRFVAPEGQRDEFREALVADEPGLPLDRLQLQQPSTSYLRDGTFSPDQTLGRLYEWSRQTFEQDDCSLIRAVGDMTWALPHLSAAFIEALTSYEARVTGWTRAYPQIGFCMYDTTRFGGEVIVPMIKAHPKVWVNGVMHENPYHINPAT